jgi:hypothetical protein
MPPAQTSLADAVVYYRELLKKDPELICLYSSNAEVDAFNEQVMKEESAESFNPISHLKAPDSKPFDPSQYALSAANSCIDNHSWGTFSGTKQRPWQWKEFVITNSPNDAAGSRGASTTTSYTGRMAGGLAPDVPVCIGARVMIRYVLQYLIERLA